MVCTSDEAAVMRSRTVSAELACPSCGSGDFTIVKRTQWWGGPNLTLKCNVCPRQWTQPEPDSPPGPGQGAGQGQGPSANGHAVAASGPPARGPVPSGEGVPFYVLCCPECGSDETKVTSTRRPIRHHKCQRCGESFKSHEVKVSAN